MPGRTGYPSPRDEVISSLIPVQEAMKGVQASLQGIGGRSRRRTQKYSKKGAGGVEGGHWGKKLEG